MPNLDEHIKLIQSLPAFDQLDNTDISLMLNENQILRVISYEPDETIIREKEFDRKIFLIITGSVQVQKETIVSGEKKIQVIKTVDTRGTFIGEMSAITGKPRTASVITLTKTICAVIDIELLLKTSSSLLERVKARFYPKLFELLSKRLTETSDNYANLKQKYEALETELIETKREKMNMRMTHQDEIRKKNMEIATLQNLQNK